MSKEKEFTVTVQPVLKTRTYVGGGDCYPVLLGTFSLGGSV